MKELLETAAEAARLAGRYQRDRFEEGVEWSYKAPGDPVSEIDRESERLIADRIADRYPDHALLSEERGESGDAPERWIVDPLDGTSNYVRGRTDFCVSIALEIDGRVRLGAVYRPMSDDLHAATVEGMTIGDGEIETSDVDDLGSALVALPYSSSCREREAVWDAHRTFGQTSEKLRSASGALDLAHVAAGKVDVACGFEQSAWDRAAGLALVEAGGGRVTDHAGRPNPEEDFVASNGPLHDAALDALDADGTLDES